MKVKTVDPKIDYKFKTKGKMKNRAKTLSTIKTNVLLLAIVFRINSLFEKYAGWFFSPKKYYE